MKFNSLIVLLFMTLSLNAQDDNLLKTYSKDKLLLDYDLAISSLKEAHAGLYWYNSRAEFDSISNYQRSKIREGMNSYDFFRILSKIVATTKEGHCRISSSRDIGQYFNKKALIIPLIVKSLNGQLYVLNDIENNKTKGQILTKINDIPIQNVIDTIFSYVSKGADGNNLTGKIRCVLDYSGLVYYYADFFSNKKTYKLELLNPLTNQTSKLKVNSLSPQNFEKVENEINYPSFDDPIELNIDNKKSTVQLSVHSFNHKYYDKIHQNEEIAFSVFCSKIDSAFTIIKKMNLQNLIIDVRNNGGGTEGYEDYLFSYLTNKPYSKYKYVEANSLSYSFLKHTEYNTSEKKKRFESYMNNEFYLNKDGRYLRKDDFLLPKQPNKNPFNGNLYILISGKTYSGGSEFAGLVKNETDAIFVGEETGGGFYGQTSGYKTTLTLSNTKIRIKIPLLKFVTTFESKDIPFGRGIIPNYPVQQTYEEFNSGIDAQLEYVLKLINENK